MAVAVWNHFSDEHEVMITGRDYAETNDVLDYYEVPFTSHGSFHEETKQKLLERTRRQKFLTENYSSVDVVVTQASIAAVAMGVGLGKPVIVLIDIPKRKYLGRQIIPTASYHLREELTRDAWEYEPDTPIYMDATQEHIYTKSVNRKNPDLVIYRNFEYQAAYARGQMAPDIPKQLRRLCSDYGLDLLELERYQEHEFVPPEQIFERARIVITGGSSMAVEATIQQIPALSFYPGYFPKFEYLMDRGYPLARVRKIQNLQKTMDSVMNKKPTKHQFQDNPLDKLAEIFKEIENDLKTN
jgi:predicted glycosyltransferase